MSESIELEVKSEMDTKDLESGLSATKKLEVKKIW